MIPKKIHYCWFGGNPLPQDALMCIESWKKYFPDYEIIEWNEKNFDMNSCDYIREAAENKKWAFVSDFARFKILYDFGGIYFDTDVEVVRNFDEIIAMGAFMGKEEPQDSTTYVINPGLGMAAVIIACPIGMYFKLFLTTRNGLFQSLAFVSIGMQIAEAEQFDKLRVSIQNAIVFVLVCAVKVFCSLFGGSDISKLLDLPTFYFMFAVIILECKENRLKGNFYKHLRSTSETMYFIHMYFVAFCALVLYKDDYNNFKSYLICAGGALAVSEIYSWMKNISNRSTTVSRLKHD